MRYIEYRNVKLEPLIKGIKQVFAIVNFLSIVYNCKLHTPLIDNKPIEVSRTQDASRSITPILFVAIQINFKALR